MIGVDKSRLKIIDISVIFQSVRRKIVIREVKKIGQNFVWEYALIEQIMYRKYGSYGLIERIVRIMMPQKYRN
ncbi:hypothetical protein D3C72_1021920 [compost metagenome]